MRRWLQLPAAAQSGATPRPFGHQEKVETPLRAGLPSGHDTFSLTTEGEKIMSSNQTPNSQAATLSPILLWWLQTLLPLGFF